MATKPSVNLDYPPGATPLDADELASLRLLETLQLIPARGKVTTKTRHATARSRKTVASEK